MNPHLKTQPDGGPSPLVILHYEEHNKRFTWITPFTVADGMRCTLTIVCDEIGLIAPIPIEKSQECDVVAALKKAVKNNHFIVLRSGLSAEAIVTYRNESGSWNSGEPVKFKIPEIPAEPEPIEQHVAEKIVWYKRSTKPKVKLWPWLMVWLTVLQKAKPDRKPSALPFQRGINPGMLHSWQYSIGKKFFSYAQMAKELWPRGQCLKIQQTTEKESENIMKDKNTEMAPKIELAGKDINILDATDKKLTGYIIRIIVDDGATPPTNAAPPVNIEAQTPQKKFVIKDWVVEFALDSKNHPCKGLKYFVEVYMVSDKKNPVLIGKIDYSSSALAHAFGTAEIDPAKPELPAKEMVPAEDITYLADWLRNLEWEVENVDEVKRKDRLKKKLGWYVDVRDDLLDIESEAVNLLDSFADNGSQLAGLLERCKALLPKVEDIIADTRNKFEAAETDKSPNIDELLAKALRDHSEKLTKALADRDAAFTQELQTLGEQLKAATAPTTATGTRSEQAKQTFLQKLGSYYSGSWLSWKFTRWALIILVTGICLYWDSKQGFQVVKKTKEFFSTKSTPTMTNTGSRSGTVSSGGIPVTPDNDPNASVTATDILSDSNSKSVAKARTKLDGVSIEVGDIGKNKGGTNNVVVTSVVILGNGDYYANGTNAVTQAQSSLLNRVRMPDMVFPLKPCRNDEILTCIVPVGAYAQISRPPIGWQIEPTYHYTTGMNPRDCFSRYANGQPIDLAANIKDADEGYLNKMDRDLIIEFRCRFVGEH